MRKVTLLMLVVLIGLVTMQADLTKPVAAQTQYCTNCPEPYGGYCNDWGVQWYWDEERCECVYQASPVVIDLDNDGYRLTNAADGVRFDLVGDGNPRQWSWTSRGSDEAFLVLDRNGDGRITSGKELFGDVTEQPVSEEPNGFTALAVFDTNGDGWIKADDAIYQRLQLWIDANHDGLSQQRELFSLSDKGVESISCNYRLSKRSDRHGNRFKFKAKARINGIERWVWDIFFLPGR